MKHNRFNVKLSFIKFIKFSFPFDISRSMCSLLDKLWHLNQKSHFNEVNEVHFTFHFHFNEVPYTNLEFHFGVKFQFFNLNRF